MANLGRGTPTVALALVLFGESCAGFGVKGDLVVRGTAREGEFQEGLATSGGRNRCVAAVHPDSSGSWELQNVLFRLGESKVWLLPEHVEVTLTTPPRTLELYKSDCSKYDVRQWMDADSSFHAVVDLDCKADDGSTVVGTVVSDSCSAE